MFTGLIQQIGYIKKIDRKGVESRLLIKVSQTMQDLESGESISVNGACLSVEDFAADWFTAYASAETMDRTNLGMLRNGFRVNLERALALGERLGGHMLSGHVDCQARIISRVSKGESIEFLIDYPEDFADYVVPKGSVALDGVSLTINKCTEKSLIVNIIPATQKKSNIEDWSPGKSLNMEVDLIAKYVAHMLKPWSNFSDSRPQKEQGITLEKLQELGF